MQKEKDQPRSEDELREMYNKETKKNAEWRGKLTKGYLDWKKEKLGWFLKKYKVIENVKSN